MSTTGKRLCPVCRRRNTEPHGHRHVACQARLDSGMTVEAVRHRVSEELLLAVLTGNVMVSTRVLIAESGMSSATAMPALKRLRAAGVLERLRVRNGAPGRTYLYRIAKREVAA